MLTKISLSLFPPTFLIAPFTVCYQLGIDFCSEVSIISMYVKAYGYVEINMGIMEVKFFYGRYEI